MSPANAKVSTKKTGRKRAHSPEKTDSDKQTKKRVKGVESNNAAVGGESDGQVEPHAVPADVVGAAAPTDRPQAPEATDEAEAPKFIGTFDLYGMDLPFLNSVYLPKGSSTVNPEALYKTILTYQAKSDRTAQLILPDSGPGSGKLDSGVFCDPMEDMPFDIVARNIKEVPKLSFKSVFGRPDAQHGAWQGVGVTASLVIEDGGCGIASSSGSISMHPMWRKVEKNGDILELFEGTLTFRVKYSSMYSRRGHGSGQNETIDFWAVRGRK
ncbi:hypothetical protein JR316_0001614 [Psilocybe cubensis]|uniref:Uncharacterized protein n=2 Tax=Psilocybe cubensis TaxID=181762 RepID=A0ACB8HBY9_PSICU|nr:hypothetical protein JR316_0001614 [Psilocybe cubensis]KAH9484714.1 hypothetical protein JR316_0001614 [Psilocybe cubensis]